MLRNKILVAEDNPSQRKLMVSILQKGGYQVFQAENGQKAIEEASKITPDLILMDYMMPEMNGLDACQILKSSKFLKEIPVIFVTALKEKEVLLQAFGNGAIDYIFKPYSKDEVIARVQAQLKYRELFDEKMELIKALQLGQQDRVLGQMSIGLAHNFNNMLTSVMGFCQLIEMTTQEEENKGRITKVRNVLNNIHKMITDLRDFSDRSKLSKQKVHLEIYLKEQVEFLKASSFSDMHVNFISELTGDDESGLAIESFTTCLYNIMKNSLESKEEEHDLVLDIHLSKVGLPQNVVSQNSGDNLLEKFYRIRFTDNGKGFDKKLGNPVEAFQPFCTTKKTVGVGLGLSVVQGFVARHKGFTDSYQNPDGPGAVVDLYFPA